VNDTLRRNVASALRPRTLHAALIVLSLGFKLLAASGAVVPSGEAFPRLIPINVVAGRPASLDLLVSTPLSENNRCRLTFFAMGGTVLAPVASEVKTLVTKSEGKNRGYRAPVSLDLPPARSGTRFLLRIESLAPVAPGPNQLIGEALLETVERSAAEELIAALKERPVHVGKSSLKLRALFDALQIPYSRQERVASGTIILAEGDLDRPNDAGPGACIRVQFIPSSGEALFLTARPSGPSWRLEVQVPRSHDLSSAREGAQDVLEVVRYILRLETNPNSTE
jgi:hypothetical protein